MTDPHTSPPPSFTEVVAIIGRTPQETGLKKSELFRLRISLAIVKQIQSLEMGYMDTMDALQGVLEDTLTLMKESRQAKQMISLSNGKPVLPETRYIAG